MVEIRRGGLVESRHWGTVAVASADGTLAASVGDPGRHVSFMRSSAKPLQALAVVATGAADAFRLTEAELAVIASSHDGSPRHTAAVASILAKIGCGERDLRCGLHRPLDPAAAEALIRAGREPSHLQHQCSGKHAGMLAVARRMGWPTEGYFSPDHPVQKLAGEIVAAAAGLDSGDLVRGTDGCGVVVFGLPVAAMALAYARLARPAALPPWLREAARRVTSAMAAVPDAVAGPRRFTTRLMQAAGTGLVAKDGAEGVFTVALLGPGLGAALKIADGSDRAVPPAVVSLLGQLGIPLARDFTARYGEPVVRNFRGEHCGKIAAVFSLTG